MTTRISKPGTTRSKASLEPRKKPIQARSIESVRSILEAATQVFEKYGYAHGTTNRIAKRAGVSIGTLYQYFPSKEAVAVALLERHLAEGQRQLNDWAGHVLASDMNLIEIVTYLVNGMLDLHADKPRLQHILLEETQIPPRLHDLFHEIEQRAAKTIAGLLKGFPEVKRGALEEASFLIVQTVEILTHRFASHPNTVLTRSQFTEELVSMITAYLKSNEIIRAR